MKVRVGQEATAFRGSAFDLKLGLEFYECLGVEAGMTHFNGSSVDDSPNHPFGERTTAPLAASAVSG
jgi:hypothetical protein